MIRGFKYCCGMFKVLKVLSKTGYHYRLIYFYNLIRTIWKFGFEKTDKKKSNLIFMSPSSSAPPPLYTSSFLYISNCQAFPFIPILIPTSCGVLV
jgi:hypothetical protein